jgi:RNA polymerase sigma-70 factor (ECF subfamily)
MSDRGELFLENRDRLFGLAYRMLGSAADADDVVQEAFLRFERAEPDQIASPAAFLTTVTTRLAIDQLRRLRAERERYIGPWLPEPLVGPPAMQADEQTALAESLSQAMLVVLETLEPAERAVFLLREVFDIDYAQIAEIIGQSATNCRQLLHRAKERISAGRNRPRGASREEHDRLTQQFFATCVSGDLDGLKSLLADDVISYHDGGGKLSGARRPLYGSDAVARFFIGITKKSPPGISLRPATVNGQPGVIAYEHSRPTDVLQFEIDDGRIRAIRVQRNPDKLTRIPRLEIQSGDTA